MLKLIQHIKGTTTKQGGAAGRQGANTENHYLDAVAWGPEQLAVAGRLNNLRAALLPTGSSIYGCTFVQLDALAESPAIPSYSNDIVYNGTANLLLDQPDSAVQVTMHSKNKPNRKELKLGFMPDARIVTGEYHNADGYSQKLEAYLNELHRIWGFRGLDSDEDVAKPNTITATGVVTFAEAPPASFVDGVTVRLLGVRSENGNAVTGTYKLRKTSDGPTIYRLMGFQLPRGEVNSMEIVKGEIMISSYIFCPYQWNGIALEEPKACRKKVGRPRDQYVGRRTKKR